MANVQKFSINFLIEILFYTVTFYYIYQWIARKLKYKLPNGRMGLPIVGCLPFLGEKPYKAIADMREKYGDIIGLKLGRYYTIVLNGFDVAKEVLSHPAVLDRPDLIFEGLPFGFGSASGAEWKEQRKFCIHLMRNLGLGRGPWETLTTESTADFIKELLSLKGQPADVTDTIKLVLSNNLISLLLGRKLNPTTEAKEIKCVVDYLDILSSYGPSVAGSTIPGYRKLCERFRLFGYDKTRENISNFCTLLKQEMEKHRSDAQYHNDFINLYDEKIKIMQSQNIHHYFSDIGLIGNMSVIYFGGTDTVVASSMWLFRLMAKHPKIQKQVQDELDEVIGADGAISFEDRYKIPYTFAVLKEAQRVSSIMPLTTTKKVAYDFEVRGYTIPKGTMVTTNTWAVHHDPKNFRNPEKFQPERFLPDKNSERSGIPKLIAFSIGKRNCPGETVAWMVILQYFTAVMKKFTISPPPETELHFEVKTGLVEHLKPLPLCFHKRN